MGRPKKSSIEKLISAQTFKTEHEKPATKKKNAKSIPQEGNSKKCSQECKSKPKAPKDGHCSPNDNKCSSKSNTIKKGKNTRRSLDINTQPKKRVRVKEEEKESNSGETVVKCPQKRATKKRSRCTDLKRGMSPPGVELGNHCHGETLAHLERHLRSGNRYQNIAKIIISQDFRVVLSVNSLVRKATTFGPRLLELSINNMHQLLYCIVL